MHDDSENTSKNIDTIIATDKEIETKISESTDLKTTVKKELQEQMHSLLERITKVDSTINELVNK